MTQQLSVVEKTDDFLRSTGPNDKWYRYLEALLQKYAKLWRLREEEKAKLDHYTRKCRDVEEELSKKQAHIVRLKAALENETQEHHLAKVQLKKLGGQLQSAKDYMLGLDTQDQKTTDLINTICASPHPFRMASAVTLGNKSGSLLDDFEDNSISTEGSVSTGGTEDIFMSFRKPDDRDKPTTSEADMNSTSSSAQSSGSDFPPLRRSLRKRNSSEESDVVISKKLKAGDKASLVVSVDEDNRTVCAEARIKTASSSNRRRSKSVDARLDGVASSTPLAPTRDPMRTPMKEESSPLYRSSSASKLMNRQHTFLTKTVMVFENCGRCKRRLKFYKEALRCDDCHLTVHLDCRADAPLPCIPKSNRPKMTGNKSQRLVDFCPVVGPRVPPILINCFHEIEKAHRIKEVGIYRLSGAQSQVQALSRKLQKHVNHDLSSYETATITGVVKQFLLESLSEPLIPSSVWTHFEKITEPGNPDVEHKIRGEVASLPVHNRDTLAFVMLHLKVVEQVPENKMNRQNLATVFAPSVVGYSLTAQMKPELLLAANQLVSERIMACLLDVDPTFWDNIMKTADKKRTTLRDRTHKNGGTISFASPKLT